MRRNTAYNFFTCKCVYLLWLSMTILRVSLHHLAQVFVKKAAIYENDMIPFVFKLYKDKMWKVKRMWQEKSVVLCDVCCSAG